MHYHMSLLLYPITISSSTNVTSPPISVQVYRNVSRCCRSTCTFSYQNYRGELRNGLQAFNPQGGESSGLVGMCLARLKTYRPASQGSQEPIGQEAALSRALVWAGLSWGGWPAVESRKFTGFCGDNFLFPFASDCQDSIFFLSLWFKIPIVWRVCRMVYVHRSLGSIVSMHTLNKHKHPYPHACFHAAHAPHTTPAVIMESSRPRWDWQEDSTALQIRIQSSAGVSGSCSESVSPETTYSRI